MSRKGYCWDNAVAESFFASLKTERIYLTKYQTRQEAKRDIFSYIGHCIAGTRSTCNGHDSGQRVRAVGLAGDGRRQAQLEAQAREAPRGYYQNRAGN